MIETKNEIGKEYQIGDVVFINDQDWIISDFVNNDVLLYRDSIDGHSRTMKYPKRDLPEKSVNS